MLASLPEVVLSIVHDYADGCSRDIVCFTRGLQNEGLNTDSAVYWLKLNFAGLLEYRNQILQKQQIRGFYYVFAEIDKRKRFDGMRPDFDWLKNAGVALPVVRSSEATFPLGLSEEGSFFKFYMSDVGLLFSTFAPVDVEQLLLTRDSINMGSASENAVAQELRAHGHESLHYFSSKGIGEVDFLLESIQGIAIQPVEVKSGKTSHKHASLDALLAVENYTLENPIVLHTRNVEADDPIAYFPIYMAAFL